MKYTIKYKGGQSGSLIKLNGSKSISNRILIIQALCGTPFPIRNLSNAKDTTTLQNLLGQVAEGTVLDAGAAGTTYRFLTAYLAFKSGTQILTGSARMKERPIKVLVEALQSLGANISYLEKEGYPPLKIGEAEYNGQDSIELPANVSSQYISALMLIAPYLKNGLKIRLKGDIVSLPYLLMTKNLIARFGGNITFRDSCFIIAPSQYKPQEFLVEGDWSAASYYYAIVALEKPGFRLSLKGVGADSLQGDQAMVEIGQYFGVESSFRENELVLNKIEKATYSDFNFDFILCPDLTQTVSVMMAGLGVKGKLTGLKTLRIKETDRIEALRIELLKTAVEIDDQGAEDQFIQAGKSEIKNIPVFDTYEDHRMAMSLASLAIKGTIQVNDPNVVKKSYPAFWEDLRHIGFEIE